MTVDFWGLSNGSFRLTDSEHSEVVTEAQPFFKLTDGVLRFKAEQISVGGKKKLLRSYLKSLFGFVKVIFDGFVGYPAIYRACSPIMLDAEIEVKNTRYSEQTIAYTPSGYAPDTHDYTAPKLEGGKDLMITPVSYQVDEVEMERRQKETLVEKLGASTALFLIPIPLMIASAFIQAGTLTMISVFAAIAFYPLIPFLLLRWRKQSKQFAEKLAQKALELNEALKAKKY